MWKGAKSMMENHPYKDGLNFMAYRLGQTAELIRRLKFERPMFHKNVTKLLHKGRLHRLVAAEVALLRPAI